MHQLARIQLTGSDGKVFSICPGDVLYVLQRAEGSTLVMRDGARFDSVSTPAVVHAALDAIWDEFITALGNP